MKLTDILDKPVNRGEWEDKGYSLPSYDIEKIRKNTYESPSWLHFGAGNIFRVFPCALLDSILNDGKYDKGVIVAESFDYEIVDKAYRPYDNLSLSAVLKSDGTVDKKVIASVTESLKADYSYEEDWARLVEIAKKESLQMISFTITEKGYSYTDSDLEKGLNPGFAMGKVTLLLLERFKENAAAITLHSMDNCAHNGDKVKNAVMAYANSWLKDGLVDIDFIEYLKTKVGFPWAMIDKITPRPDEKVKLMLEKDGFEDTEIILTDRGSFTAPFVNAEETGYLVVEDDFPNGKPPLDKAGVLYADRATVDKVERMKVQTCLNPLHTSMSIIGCLLGYTLISEEMKDDDIKELVTKIGYEEGMPVVTDPGVLKPEEFLDAVLTKRLPNPFMPDAPQRIATDTSQKLSVRFGETIKAYLEKGLSLDNLKLIPFTLAAYSRYLKGIDDELNAFTPSNDPLLEELQAIVTPLEIGKEGQDFSVLNKLYSREDIFGLNLYEAGLGEKIEKIAEKLFCGKGAVRKELHAIVNE